MFGFFVGFACLYGLVRVLRGNRGYCGGGSWRSRRGWGRKRGDKHHFFLRRMFERLDTTPGQEKEIKRAVDEVMDAARALKDDLGDTREQVGKAFEGESFDVETMADLLTKNDEKLDAARKAIVGALARVHETLDADQRGRLADFLRRGPRWGGPYRSYA
jgi:Spy/CpxP family protein refolding chaperone